MDKRSLYTIGPLKRVNFTLISLVYSVIYVKMKDARKAINGS
jgi:hypothetical protein